jgi:DNA polymerase III delta subunit
MIIVLYGADAYTRHQKLAAVLQEFSKRQGVAHESFDMEAPEEGTRFRNFVLAPSLFAAPRLARVLNLAAAGKEAKQTLKAAAEAPSITLVVSEATIPTDFKFLLKAPNKIQKFEAPKAEKLLAFIATEAKARGLTIEKNAAQFLAGATKGDTWAIVHELEKASLGKVKELTVAALRGAGLRAEYDFWSMVSGWERRSLGERLVGLETLLAAHEDAAKIFNLLAYAGPDRARHFADYDLSIKSGKLDYEEAVLDFALSA